MKNIYVIPTDKPSRLVKNDLGIVINEDFTQSILDLIQAKFVNIYITNDEKIKEGDWIIQINFERTCINVVQFKYYGNGSFTFKKIILTTDQDLIKDGVQAIDDEFLEWFVKNPSCEEVEVVDEIIEDTSKNYIIGLGQPCITVYKIIIPKEEAKYTTSNLDNEKYKDYSVAKQRAKNYMSLKGALDSHYVDFSNPNADKITSASTTTIKEEPKQELDCPYDFTSRCTMGRCDCKPKQETLEEAAEKYSEVPMFRMGSPRLDIKRGFELGAKWQQERSYSEAVEFGKWLDENTQQREYYPMSAMTMEELFEQFKKK